MDPKQKELQKRAMLAQSETEREEAIDAYNQYTAQLKRTTPPPAVRPVNQKVTVWDIAAKTFKNPIAHLNPLQQAAHNLKRYFDK